MNDVLEVLLVFLMNIAGLILKRESLGMRLNLFVLDNFCMEHGIVDFCEPSPDLRTIAQSITQLVKPRLTIYKSSLQNTPLK